LINETRIPSLQEVLIQQLFLIVSSF